MANLFDTDEQFENIKKSVSSAVKDALNVEGKRNRLVVKRVWVDDKLDTKDLKSQLDAKMGRKTWGVPLYADVVLQDSKSKEVIDRRRVKVLEIPKITPRYSFIINGSEFQVSNQLRLKPGAYTRKRKTGETETQINLAKGLGTKGKFHLSISPKTGDVMARIGSVKVNAYTLLKILGVHDKEMINTLGEDIHSSMVTPNVDGEILKLSNSLTGKKETNVEAALSQLRERFDSTVIDPETTEATLGKAFKKVNGGFMLRVVKKLVSVNRGDAPVDNRDEIRFKQLLTPDDLLEQRITKNVGLIRGKLLRKIDTSTEVRQVIQPKQVGKLIYSGRGEGSVGSFFNSSTLAHNPTQVNPVDFLSGFSKVTYMGEGGMTSRHTITLPTRNISPSQVGFLDPVQTPESHDIGIVNHFPLGAVKERGEIRARVENRAGKEVALSAGEMHDQVVAFPGELDEKWRAIRPGKVKAYSKGEVIDVVPKDVTHRYKEATNLYGIGANLIPFLSADQGARAMMGTKMIDQAVPLVEREAPLVQSVIRNGVSTDEVVGSEFSLRAPVAGTIKSVKDGVIVIKDKSGKSHKIQYYEDFPLNSDVSINSHLKVQPGDSVKKDQLIADTNFTDEGTLALGKNLRIGYFPYRGYTFEDGVVVSETAAKKMTSDHLHKVEAPQVFTGGTATIYDRKKFSSYYPTKFEKDQLEKLDDQGIVRVGQTIRPGDPVIAYMQEKELTPEDIALGKLRKSIIKPYRDKSITWDIEDEGVVTRVAKTPEGPVVYVKTKEPIRLGDKLAGRHGNKGVVTAVIADREMPKTKDGDPLDIIMDPHGIPSRINVGQVLESVAGKIAKKSGGVYKALPFTDKSYIEEISKQLKKSGIEDTEEVLDPATNEVLGKPLVGYQYIMKLKHPVRTKFSGRSTGKYTLDMRPAKGGDSSAQSLDPLKMFSMIAHGAKANLHEMSTLKAEDNPEWWAAIQRNDPTPAPKPTFAWNKFVSMMQAAGVNVSKEGSSIRPIPMTDDEILSMSTGAIKDARYFRAKDLRPEKGGLFDPVLTGGVGGGRWTHIPLAEAMPNPMFEDAIRSLTNLKEKDFKDIVSGRTKVSDSGELVKEASDDGGGEGIRKLLSRVDLDSEIKKEEERAKGLKGAELNKANKRVHIMRNLRELKIRPEDAFVLNNVPVIPPKYRPVYPDDSGVIVESPLNHLYKNTILVNRALKDSKSLPLENDRARAREELYDALKVFDGLASPSGARKELMSGILDIIASKESPKHGYFQSKLLSKRQDISGRSTIILNPDLHMDEAGIPEEMAWRIFEPFIQQNLIASGYSMIDALKLTKDRDPRAKVSLDTVIQTRPVMLNRAPSLHKHSVLAFKPVLVKGKSIQIPPLVVKGFNADFDGDTMSVEVPVTREAVEEAAEMFPSKNMLSTSGQILTAPSQASQLGLYVLTRQGKKTGKKYKTPEDAILAHKKGDIKTNDVVSIAGVQTTPGRILINKVLPPRMRDPEIVLDKKRTSQILKELARKSPKEAPAVAEKLKEIGFRSSYETGFSVALGDFKVNAPIRDRIVGKVRKEIEAIKSTSLPKKDKERKIQVALSKAQGEMADAIKKNTGEDNNLATMVNAGARGSWGQVQQMIGSPVAVEDIMGKTVPMLIENSYSEGLTPAEYYTAMHGGRKGMIEKTLQTAEPGALNKQLLHTAIDYTITENDCGTSSGIKLPIHSQEVVDRYLAEKASKFARKGDLVTPELVDRLVKAGTKTLKVRSPATCESAKGICKACTGVDEYGKEYTTGANIGAISTQSITEPATQLTMQTFHTGGLASAEDKIVDSFQSVRTLLTFPKQFPNKATIAEEDGKVESMSEAAIGGWNVQVGGKTHYVSPGQRVLVKQNEKVVKGSKISTGTRDPQDVLRVSGMDEMRNALAEDLSAVYRNAGPYVKRKHFETVVRAATNSARVRDPGKSEFVAGDIVPYNLVRSRNMENVKEVPVDDAVGKWLAEPASGVMPESIMTESDVETLRRNKVKTVKVNPEPIDYEPILRGIKMIPLERRDWLSQLAATHLKDAMKVGIPAGYKSDLHDTNPIPGIIYGAEFNTKKAAQREGYASFKEMFSRQLSDAIGQLQVSD